MSSSLPWQSTTLGKGDSGSPPDPPAAVPVLPSVVISTIFFYTALFSSTGHAPPCPGFRIHRMLRMQKTTRHHGKASHRPLIPGRRKIPINWLLLRSMSSAGHRTQGQEASGRAYGTGFSRQRTPVVNAVTGQITGGNRSSNSYNPDPMRCARVRLPWRKPHPVDAGLAPSTRQDRILSLSR